MNLVERRKPAFRSVLTIAGLVLPNMVRRRLTRSRRVAGNAILEARWRQVVREDRCSRRSRATAVIHKPARSSASGTSSKATAARSTPPAKDETSAAPRGGKRRAAAATAPATTLRQRRRPSRPEARSHSHDASPTPRRPPMPPARARRRLITTPNHRAASAVESTSAPRKLALDGSPCAEAVLVDYRACGLI